MAKFINIKYTSKDNKLKEIVINADTIKRLIPEKNTIIILTPIFPRGMKTQPLRLSSKHFKEVEEQIYAR